jgi:CHAT domain-containing protein
MRWAAVVFAVALSVLPLAAAERAPISALEEVAQLRRDGQFEEAVKRARAGLAAAEAQSGKESVEAARWLTQLASTLEASGEPAAAEPLFKRVIAIYEKVLGPAAAETGVALSDLASVYIDLQRLGEAERTLTRALAVLEAARGPEHRDVADCLNTLALLYVEQGRLREAEPLFLRVVAIDEKVLGPAHHDTAASLNNLAELYANLGRYDEAEPMFKRALAIDERHYGADSPQAAWDLSNLATLYRATERFAEAEGTFARALDIREKKLGDHRDTATTLASFADLMLVQGRYGEAEPLLKRALAINEKTPGAMHPETAETVSSLGALYRLQGKAALARSFFARALGILEKALGADNFYTAAALSNLAVLDRDAGRLADAAALLKRAVAILETTLDASDVRLVGTKGNLAAVYLLQGRLAEAEAGFREGLGVLERVMPPDHPSTGMAQYWLARTLLAAKKYDEAVTRSRRAGEIVAARKARSLAARLSGGVQEAFSADHVFALEARAAFALARAKRGDEERLRDAAFAAAQRATFDETGRAVAHMAARAAAGTDALAQLLREQQDLLRRLQLLDQRIANAIGARDPATRAQAAPLREESAGIGARLAAIDAALRRDHRAYAELADPKAVSVAETQALLAADEAVVLPFVLEEETLLFAVTKTSAIWASTGATAASVAKDVAALRKQLNPSRWEGTFAPFDRRLSHRLYQQLWAPLEAALDAKTQVFVVPTGPLTSLPFAVLVTAPPAGNDGDPKALRETAWLIRRHALVTLPSVSSLKALRHYASKGAPSEAFAGFGDPALSGAAAKPLTAGSRSVGSVYRGVAPDPNELRALDALPGTAAELKALAKALGAADGDVYLRERATETRVKAADLSKKRVIAFATHGLMAGDMGLGEPGLVLTPPATVSALDDGYLSASEAARLNLRAEWIILSACNTAAGDAPGARGLSGLARAFFLAGARSLLVSHWPVWDDVASRLTTATVTHHQAARGGRRAEALRRATLAVMDDASEPRFAHPAAWAPFVLVGE